MDGRMVVKDSFDELEMMLRNVGASDRKICIITDDHVSEFYLGPIYDIASRVGGFVHMMALREGEKYKNQESLNGIYEGLIRHNFSRDDYIISLGGGVVGDIAGFAAATFNRGMKLVQIPTSLLAQVDQSIGGKTGIDFLGIKNAIGAFYPSVLTYTNISTLKTLSDREFSNGMAEAIKHGLILDENYFDFVESNSREVMARGPELTDLINGSIAVKTRVVSEDPIENGNRMLLNFGHTIGHAIESQSEYKLKHGDCVSRGMVAAAEISRARGLLKDDDLYRIREVLTGYNLTIYYENDNPEGLLEFIHNDKKIRKGKISFVLLNNIGNAFVDETVTDEEIVEAVKKLHEK